MMQVQVQLPFLCGTGPSVTHSQLDLPSPNSSQEDAPTDMLTGQSDGDTFSIQVPASQVCPVDNQDQPLHPASSFASFQLPSTLKAQITTLCPPPPGHSVL